MDQVIVKSTKRGVTVYVPYSQCAAFEWIISEGEIALSEMVSEGQYVTEGQDDWNGFDWK